MKQGDCVNSAHRSAHAQHGQAARRTRKRQAYDQLEEVFQKGPFIYDVRM